MECPKCHAENRDDSRFCSNCAAPLAQTGLEAASITKTLVTPAPPISKDALIAGKYRIVDELGRGGMGVVYKAEDTRLKRTVALKFLPPELTHIPEVKDRFIQEARAASALDHPNICNIHEIAETEDGQIYIAMAFYEGESLREKILRGPLETNEAVDLAIQAASGMAKAHGTGIIHRDIKPANILITKDGLAKVVDFGLAKLAGQVKLTREGTTVGTVAYMSPEQARGEAVDQRTDIWSLGVVLYEMLTEELPFKGDRDLSIIHSIVHEDPKPIRQKKPPVPEELQRIVNRALQKKREARYGSAEEMLKDLKGYEAALQAEASGVFHLRSLLKRLRRPAVAVPTVLAVAGIAALAVWFFNRQAKVRWARNIAIPEIERMIEANDAWRNLVPPYRLAERAEAIIPRDPRLAELFSKCSLNVGVKTEPPGADIFIKEYDKPGDDWKYLGVSPLEKVRLPIGIFRWKIEKDGYETVLAASSTWMAGGSVGKPGAVVPYDLVRTMDPEGSVPEGMVRVPATGSLETKQGFGIVELLRRLAKEQGKCVIVASHDLRLREFADRIFRLEDGRLQAEIA